MSIRTLALVSFLALCSAAWFGAASTRAAAPPAPGEGASTADAEVTPTHPELRAELLELRERDQAARERMVEAMQSAQRNENGGIVFSGDGAKAFEEVRAIDAESSAFLEKVVDEHGWPTITMVGEDGATAAWLLVQHADARPELQERALELMRPLLEIGEVARDDFALLTDRVLCARGEPQIYATQFVNDADGVLRPRPTVDFENVDARRAEMGLRPLAEYAKALEETYGDKVSLVPIDPES